MRVSNMKAPETMPTIFQDHRIESSATNERETRPINSSVSPHAMATHREVTTVKHYTTWTRLREQQGARDYWQRVYGVDAERASRGGVTWLV